MVYKRIRFVQQSTGTGFVWLSVGMVVVWYTTEMGVIWHSTDMGVDKLINGFCVVVSWCGCLW